MTNKEFNELQKEIQKTMLKLSDLQVKHRKETGRDFICGQPIMADPDERLWGEPKAEYKVPSHLRGEIDLHELRKDLNMLNKPLLGGGINHCYGDGYFMKSLERKYGKSIDELNRINFPFTDNNA